MGRPSTTRQRYTTTNGGMSYDEIALVMGLSHETVRKIEKKALEKLKRFENRFTLQEIKETIAMLDRPRTPQFLHQ